MSTAINADSPLRHAHSWLKKTRIAFVARTTTPLLDEVITGLRDVFQRSGHIILESPEDSPDVLVATAPFGEPINWRSSLFLTARRRFKLTKQPVVFTLLHATRHQLIQILAHFRDALAKETLEPADFTFPGLAPFAHETLIEQGQRGGPILSLIRLVQAQAKCIRILLVIGDGQVEEAYTFDLVGAHPRTIYGTGDGFYEDLMVRILTAVSTQEITHHETVYPPVPGAIWKSLSSPEAMRRAGAEFGKRRFFTDMVQINRLVYIPALHGVIADQYSEGCFSTWDPYLGSLIATVTGSARPVDKDNLSDDDLAVIVGIKPDGSGALVRQVEGLKNDPPSSEAVEMLQIDQALPFIPIHTGNHEKLQVEAKVPVIRSKLHGHRGVRAYNPRFVEFIELDEPYYYYPVSCSTDAQARAVSAGFQRSISLNNPADPRQVVFSVLPGHGVVIAEKWQEGKAPFQLIWEYMDDGKIVIDNLIPQGPFRFKKVSTDLAILVESEEPFSPG